MCAKRHWSLFGISRRKLTLWNVRGINACKLPANAHSASADYSRAVSHYAHCVLIDLSADEFVKLRRVDEEVPMAVSGDCRALRPFKKPRTSK